MESNENDDGNADNVRNNIKQPLSSVDKKAFVVVQKHVSEFYSCVSLPGLQYLGDAGHHLPHRSAHSTSELLALARVERFRYINVHSTGFNEPCKMLLNILALELHMLPAAALLVLLLPLSSVPRVRYYGCFAAYVLLASCAALVLLPIFLFRPKDVRNCVLTGRLLRHISKLVGIRWELRRGRVLAEQRGAVIVANHQSMFDILGMFDFWSVMGRCAAVARKELFYVWPFGLAAWAAGVVFIDRDRRRAANEQLREASALITGHKTKLWLFPEGTRNRAGEGLLPFKRGAFRVAVACQAPLIPVVYSPYYFIDSRKKVFGHGRIIVHVLDPIPTQGKTEKDIDELMAHTRQLMLDQYNLLREEVLSTNNNIIEQRKTQ